MGGQRGSAGLVDTHIVESSGALHADGRVGGGINRDVVDESSGGTLEADGGGTAAGSDNLEGGEVALHIIGGTAVGKAFHCVCRAVDGHRHGAAVVGVVGVPSPGLEDDADAAHTAQVDGGSLNPAILGTSANFDFSIGGIALVAAPAGECRGQRSVVEGRAAGFALLRAAAGHTRKVFREDRVILRAEGENRHQCKDKKGKDFFHF